MHHRKSVQFVLGCIVLCLILGLAGGLWLKTERETRHIAFQATQTWIDTLTTQYGAELSQLIAAYEYGRWETSEKSDLTVTVTHHYVIEYTETRCQAYAAVAIDSEHIYNPLDSSPCGFCAVYIFARANSQQPWKFAAFLPIMGNYNDHLRDWDAHHKQFEGLIEIRPEWEACPYYVCSVK